MEAKVLGAAIALGRGREYEGNAHLHELTGAIDDDNVYADRQVFSPSAAYLLKGVAVTSLRRTIAAIM